MEFLGMLDIMQGVVHKKRRNSYGHFLCPPPTVLCIAVKVAVCHEIDTKCDFYDFPMPVYALETIYINFLRNF